MTSTNARFAQVRAVGRTLYLCMTLHAVHDYSIVSLALPQERGLLVELSLVAVIVIWSLTSHSGSTRINSIYYLPPLPDVSLVIMLPRIQGWPMGRSGIVY